MNRKAPAANKKVRILYLISTSRYGGAESNLLALLQRLNRDAFETYVIAQNEGELVEDFRRHSLQTLCLNLQNIFDLKTVMAIRMFIKEKKIDLVHTHCFTADILGCMAAKTLRGIKLISTIHGFNFTSEEYENKLIKAKKKLFSLLYRFVYLFFDCVIANSEAVRRDLTERPGIGLSGKQIEQLYPLSVNMSSYGVSSGPSAPLLTAVPAGNKVVLTVANFFKNKGHAVLLRALPLVLKSFRDVKFILVGDGPERRNLEVLARELGVSAALIFAGYSKYVPKFIMASDIVVSPSYFEGFCLSVLEALSYGKPVIAAASGGVSEIIEDKKTGLLFPPGNHVILASAISGFLSDYDAATRLGKNAKESIEKKFNHAALIRKAEKIYQRVYNN